MRVIIGVALGVCALALGFPGGCLGGTAHADPLQVFEVWGTFKAVSSAIVSPHTTDTVKIERAATGLVPGSSEVWVAERTTANEGPLGSAPIHQWADSRSCPSLIPTLGGLAALEPVSIQPPGLAWPVGMEHSGTPREERLRGERDAVVYDGGDYEIEARGHWASARMEGSVILRGGAGTPAATWVKSALKALAPCWSSKSPI